MRPARLARRLLRVAALEPGAVGRRRLARGARRLRPAGLQAFDHRRPLLHGGGQALHEFFQLTDALFQSIDGGGGDRAESVNVLLDLTLEGSGQQNLDPRRSSRARLHKLRGAATTLTSTEKRRRRAMLVNVAFNSRQPSSFPFASREGAASSPAPNRRA